MNITLPAEIEHYEGELRFFIELMVWKLHTNRHKGFGEGKSVSEMFARMQDEAKELSDAISSESQFDVALESADVANFAFLTALVALRQTKEDFENGR